MATHHCIGNPCWICYPDLAPKREERLYDYWQQRIQDYQYPNNQISNLLKEMIIDIFKSGLDEDMYYRCNQDITFDKIKEERSRIPNDSLEAKLLDLLIEDVAFKGDGR
jgi:hypothetical protein